MEKQMKYKVIDVETDYEEVVTGTCELCMSTEYINHGSIILEDENGTEVYIPLFNSLGWGYYDEIYINNIVDFSAWLQEQDIEPIVNDEFYRLEELLELYKKGQ